MNAAIKYLVFALVFIVTLSSCKNDQSNNNHFAMLNATLRNANSTIKQSTETYYRALEGKLQDRLLADKAAVWFPKAILIKSLSDSIYDYIESLRGRLTSDEHDRSNKEIVNTIFNNVTKNEFSNRLEMYQQKLLAIDSEISNEFRRTIEQVHISVDADSAGKINFQNIPVAEAATLLSMIQSRIRINENKFTSFCFSNTTPVVLHCLDFPVPFINQSSNIVQPGDRIEIKAGIVNSEGSIRSRIFINGKEIPQTNDYIRSLTIKASSVIGNHYAEVKFIFNDENGKEQTQTTQVKYEVKNCN